MAENKIENQLENTKENQKENQNPIQVADRIFIVMETLAETGPVGLLELSKRLGLHKSTLHRILNSLIYSGYARQDEETGKYALSFRILNIANQFLQKLDMVDVVRPLLKKLMENTKETVHFVQLDGLDGVYIDKVESMENSVRMVSKVGSRIPLYCSGVGKAMLAEMEPEKIKKIWEESEIRVITEHTITQFPAFMDVIDQVKEQGYALDMEENEIGVRCVAVALPRIKGTGSYAISISAPVARMGEERIHELAGFLLAIKTEMQHK